MAGRIKLLFLASTPAGMPSLRVGAEAARIKEALKSTASNRFDFDENHAVRLDQLQQLVVDAAAQVVHFAGHGASTGELVFEDHDGNPRPANPAAIKKLFELAGEQTRLVVLNACYSHDQALAIADHVDVVIGVSAALADRAAIAFSSELYRWLAQGFSIGKAFELAKNQVSLQDLAGDRRDVVGDEKDLHGDHMPQIVHGPDVDPDKVFLTGPESVAARAMRPPVPAGSGSVIEKIRALVAADRLGDALELLHGQAAGMPAQHLDELTLLSRQWNQIERENSRGDGSGDLDASRETLARAILRLLRELDRPRPAPGPLRALDPHELRIRRSYLKHTRRHVENLMTESIHNARFLDLGIADAPVATHLPWVYKNADSTQEFGSVEEAFRAYDRRLLLLGGPGAGKTVTLQHLALALIGEADADPAAPVPLIVNLSRFRFQAPATRRPRLGFLTSGDKAPPPPDRSFEAWLAGELVERRVDRAVAQRWVAEGRIAAFLDGLDEVNDERRAELAVLLNTTFLHDHPDAVVVVCSRIDDYQPLQGRLSTRLQLAGAVTLQPLGPAQIDAYLEAARASGLREALGRDNSLSELAQTPLTLSMMTLAYGGKSAAGIPSLPRLADQRHLLMESFIARMLQRKERRDRGIPFDDDPDKEIAAAAYRYHPDQVNRYLSWLAVRLSMRMQTACSLGRLSGFLELRAPVEESRLTSWIMRLSKAALLAILMAVVALALAPSSRAGVIGSAVVLLASCAVYARAPAAGGWNQKARGGALLFAIGVGLFWWAAVSHSLLAIWPAATARGLGLIALTGTLALGMVILARVESNREPLLIAAGTGAGLVLGIGALWAGIGHMSADLTLAAGMVLGQIIAILILCHQSADSRKEAWQATMVVVGVLGTLLGLQEFTLRLTGELPWQLALGLVCASLIAMFWLITRPTASVLMLVLFVAGGSVLGGQQLAILGGGMWGVGLSFLAITEGSSERLDRVLDRINGRVERAFDRPICTPAARVFLALSRILPWRLRSFLLYGGQALILKPFSGDIEFVHRRLRDYFALRELVPRLEDPAPDRRAEMIRTLGFQGVSAVDTLAELLTEGHTDERLAVIGALGRIAAPEVAEHLKRAFADPDPRMRRAVVDNLRNLPAGESDALLRAAMTDADPEVRRVAVASLRNVPTRGSSGYLLHAAMADHDIGVIEAAIDVLGLGWDESREHQAFRVGRIQQLHAIIPVLRAALARDLAVARDDVRRLVRHIATQAPPLLAQELGVALPASTRGIVAELLTDPAVSVRVMACRWIGRNAEIRDVERLARMLHDSHAAVRATAVASLSSAPGPQAVQPLVHALNDRDAGVRTAAAEALGKREDARSARALIRAAADRNAKVRAAALAGLDKPHVRLSPHFIRHLHRILRDRRTEIRSVAPASVEECADPQIVEALVQTLVDQDMELRVGAASSLGAVGDPRAVDPLIHALADTSVRVRAGAARSLGTLRDARAVDPLIHALADTNVRVRAGAAESLGMLRDVRAVDPLLHALADRDDLVRARAARSLGMLRDVRAVDPLLHALADPIASVRAEAATGLGELQDARAIVPLERALLGESPGVRAHIEDVLYSLPVMMITAQLASEAVDNRRTAARVLRGMRDRHGQLFRLDPRALEPVLAALIDGDAEVRCDIAEVLGAVHDARAADALSRALLDASSEVQLAAAMALAGAGDLRGEDVLVQWLARSDGPQDETVWRHVIRSLARIDSARARSALQAYLSRESPENRTAVVAELARARDPTERALLSRDCDGAAPWIDPQHPITQERIEVCSDRLMLSAEKVRTLYEVLAPVLGLRLSWM